MLIMEADLAFVYLWLHPFKHSYKSYIEHVVILCLLQKCDGYSVTYQNCFTYRQMSQINLLSVGCLNK